MPLKTRIDINSPNFDLFFAQEFKNKITPQGKEGLPRDISFKIFRKGDEFNPKNTSRLSFMERMFVMWKALKKRWWIVVEDDEQGLGMDDFCAQWQEQRKAPKSKEFSESANFILCSKEVGNVFAYLNELANGPAYNYALKSKNNFPNIPNPAAEHAKRSEYLCRFLAHYEGNKKKWVSEMSISIPEFLVLIYLYQHKEVAGAYLYNDYYKRAYQSSPTKIKTSFGTLQHRGYIQKIGITRGAIFKITPLGIDIINTILSKYIVNC
jgi:hypothetical protein